MHFCQEICDLHKHGYVSEKSALKQQNPTLHNGILKVKGRLEHSSLPERQRFPIMLPPKSHLSQLIIDYAHKTSLHGTIHLTLARVCHEYWILNGRNTVKSHIHRCMSCYGQMPKPMTQLMALLPAIKTTPARAFLHCGLYFANRNKRLKQTQRTYRKGIYLCLCLYGIESSSFRISRRFKHAKIHIGTSPYDGSKRFVH